ncbi:hypothetical protein SAMN06265222_101603 [Neorhodopirellula lusitana]|uniref:Uncharacterized protein n=1 Tax=Neorhodopirellula lusitana TaxID=445327 RepID=A0ABY1PQX5_9BACT|nr:hypothetical protein SAMN06265222_101603 [Neorhodopirellula lusitana]
MSRKTLAAGTKVRPEATTLPHANCGTKSSGSQLVGHAKQGQLRLICVFEVPLRIERPRDSNVLDTLRVFEMHCVFVLLSIAIFTWALAAVSLRTT